jgi:hypothetical protein
VSMVLSLATGVRPVSFAQVFTTGIRPVSFSQVLAIGVRPEMRWTTTMKILSRGLCCPQSIAYGVGLFCCCSTRESIQSSQ